MLIVFLSFHIAGWRHIPPKCSHSLSNAWYWYNCNKNLEVQLPGNIRLGQPWSKPNTWSQHSKNNPYSEYWPGHPPNIMNTFKKSFTTHQKDFHRILNIYHRRKEEREREVPTFFIYTNEEHIQCALIDLWQWIDKGTKVYYEILAQLPPYYSQLPP